MANKAISKVVIQVALVVGLVLAANAIKPFSPGNVALHTLASARSFSFVLPNAAVERIEHVNYLARTFSKGWFEEGENNSVWPRKSMLKSGLLVSNYSMESFDGAEIKDVTPAEPARKQAPAKRSTRRVRQGNRDNHDEVSTSNSNASGVDHQIAQIAMLPVPPAVDALATVQPMRLPVFKPVPVKAHLMPASVMFPLPVLPAKLNSCKTIEVREVKLIALIQQSQQSPKLKVDLPATQPAKISLQCREEEKVITEETESVVETTTTTGPEEELFFDQPFAAAPVPECIRFP